ncbi:MAG: N-6 DNA methylase [Spirochaetaceae bacterium]|jgi:phospholipid N-methyltransferase|nr:N-6 DNA methylase [Spirochaetaceae bacterium]
MGDLYQQYYTKSKPIVNYMISQLAPKPSSLILEPCAGDGVFIDALLAIKPEPRIEAFELDANEAQQLERKYQSHPNIKITNTDTLLYKPFVNGQCNNKYDYIIANPPYGAWQDYEKRESLQNIYDGIYVKETYSTFLYLCISLLKEGGRLVFIIPSTYLNLHSHAKLRKKLIEQCIINEIDVFPSNFFPGVSFGYSDLSIITLEKSSDISKVANNDIVVRSGFESPDDLTKKNKTDKTIIPQKEIQMNSDHAFVVCKDKNLDAFLKSQTLRIGDIANCVTGIYTGDDIHYIKVSDYSIKNGKRYPIITKSEIYHKQQIPPLYGLETDAHFVPIVKGGNTRYLKDNNWFIDWSKHAVTHYNTNKKARFQNSAYYFKEGIAVPMVSSHSITASLLKRRIFDQSIVGVFPKDQSLIYYLLAFFNSSIATKLIRAINPSANNSANYVKKMPIIIPDQSHLYFVNSLVKKILNFGNTDDRQVIENKLSNFFDELFCSKENLGKTRYAANELFDVYQQKNGELFAETQKKGKGRKK